MRELLLRILRRSLFIAVSLAAIGYAYARLAIMVLSVHVQTDAEFRESPNHEELIWRIPLRLALFGTGLLIACEVLFYLIRGNPKPVSKKKPFMVQ